MKGAVWGTTWSWHVPERWKRQGVEVVPHRHFDVVTQTLCFDDILAARDDARAGDLIDAGNLPLFAAALAAVR